MRDRLPTTEVAPSLGTTGAGPQTAPADNQAAGAALIGRMTRFGAHELLGGLHGDGAHIGAFLDAAASRGELRGAVHQLTAQQSQGVLQPALRRLAGQPLTSARKDMLQTVFDGTPDGYNVTLMWVFELRFGLHRVGLTRGEGAIWDTTGLRHAWVVMAALPEAHTENRPELAEFTRDPRGNGGVYIPDSDAISIEAGNANFYRQINADANLDHNAGDALDASNFFDATVRHEVGHSVDARINASTGYCMTAPGGTWQIYDTTADMLVDLYRAVGLPVPAAAAVITGGAPPAAGKAGASAGAAAPVAPAPTVDVTSFDFQLYSTCLTYAGAQGTNPDMKAPAAPPVAAPGRNALAAFLAAHAQELTAHGIVEQAHQLATLLTAGINADTGGGPNAWDHGDGGSMHVGSRTFFRDQGNWSSYATEARARKVSAYQFRSPFEWFAECYAAYYDPRGGGHGGLLATKDPSTKQWFDQNVDNLGTAPNAGRAPGNGGNRSVTSARR